MEHEELFRRAEDLAGRCERGGMVTSTGFLTPAEQYALSARGTVYGNCRLLFCGGHPDCERKAAFFLPFYLDEEAFDEGEYIRALSVTAPFGEPGHRDYLGAVLGLGVKREWVGDVWVSGSRAVIFCLPSVEKHLLLSLDKVGRYGVKTAALPLDQLEAPEKRMKETVFSVKSPRLDAVAAGLFGLSRTAAAELIAAGAVSLNYAPCTKPDAAVKEGDVLSVRGSGKGRVLELGGVSRKGRLFVKTGKYE